MEFQNMKRRELQSLCKLNNIPANLTNAAMATALSNLPTVEGLEELLRNPTAADFGSPDVPRTSTRQKVTIEESEGTRRTTRRRAVAGSEATKTPATRTTRKKASEQSTVQKRVEKVLQAEFEADLEQSQSSDNSGLLGESMGISEDVSVVTMDNEKQVSSVSQTEPEKVVPKVVNVIEEVVDVDDNSEKLEDNDAVIKDIEEPVETDSSSRKVDFHSLGRRDLQSLCKKNKIPANTTNATMADALNSLEIVEGLEEFIEGYGSQAPHSPTMSEMTSSCARRTWTSRKVSKEPASSKMITKSCRVSRRKVIEEMDGETTSAVSQVSKAGTVVSSVESVQKAKQSENIECPRDGISDEGGLTVADEAEIEGPEVQDFADKQSVDIECPRDVTKDNEVASDADEGGLTVADEAGIDGPEVHDFADKQSVDIESPRDVTKDNEVASDEVASDADSENNELEDDNEDMSAKSLEDCEVLSDAGSEDGSENSESGTDDASAQRCTEVHDFADKQSVDIECPRDVTKDNEVASDADSGNSELENDNEDISAKSSEDCEVLSDAGSEDGSENSKLESGTDDASAQSSEDDEVSTDAGSENESDNSEFEVAHMNQILDEFEPELTATADEVNNAKTESNSELPIDAKETESKHVIEENTSTNDAPLISQTMKMIEASNEEQYTSEEANSEQPPIDAPETPLDNKSIRILKRMLKEKLQAATLAKKMETLTLKDKVDSLAEVEKVTEFEDLEVKKVGNENVEDISESKDANAVNLYPVDKILDNLISEETVTGDINVESDGKMSSEKLNSITPSKMPKTPVSVARMNPASDINKENIDHHSAGRTDPTKITAARSGKLLSALSIGKLKKELEKHSEKKRPALLVRSENVHLLSP